LRYCLYLSRRVLGHSLGTFRDGVLGQFSGQQQTDGSLDFAGRDGALSVVAGNATSFSSDTFEDIVDKGVHDAHSLGGDTSLGMDLLQHLVDIGGVAFLSLSVTLGSSSLGGLGSGLLGSSGLLSSGFLSSHDVVQISAQLFLGGTKSR
jgi:hypothetical protein